ncbi:MAG: carbamoyltransferase HypF, partial [Candidatus Ranarchaeia archaeon]
MRALIHAQGIVQGVGFRPYVYRLAKGHFLNGYVLNLGDAGVEILIEGEEDSINLFLRGLVDRAPPLATIAKVDVKRLEGPEKFKDFRIRQSKLGGGGSGWVIPPDIAICNDCLKELKDNKDRRHDYYFTTCTNCGPRFTMTYRVPYDRVSTSMRDFNMCSKCGKEYTNPYDRRFHAQTIACPDCGPKLYLTNSNGIKIASRDPIADAINTLRSGSILAIKGIGGFHIACVVTNEDAIEQIRKSKERSQKPFAIMSKDIQTIRKYAEVPPELYSTLISPIRPIALLRKLHRVGWVEHVSPGLDTVGVMLPYTGLHYLLLENLDTPALVMTSGNPVSEPIVANNDEAVKKLGGFVDLFLMHEREITQKTDDSVVRWTDDHLSIIRRSRGFVPTPVRVKQLIPWTVIALGGELNVTSCVLNKQQAFLSQHLGDMDREANYAFNEKVSRYIIAMTRTQIDAVACDLHPQFATTELGVRLSKELDVPLMKIQHHEAHAASILGEHNIPDLVAICTDGFGLGSDGLAWGGEVFHCNRRTIQRVGHLQPQPLIGGDL